MDLFEAAKRGEIILGGCDLSPVGPIVGCPGCGHQWVLRGGRVIPPDEAERIDRLNATEGSVVRNRSTLLALNESSSLQILADMCVDDSLDGDLTISALPRPFGAGVRLHYECGWFSEWVYDYDLYYPFTNEHFWAVVDDLGDLARFDMGMSGLKETICIVEGLTVEVAEEPLLTAGSRRTLMGRWIHNIVEYPYSTPMQGRAKIATWRTRRFLPHFPGLSVQVLEFEVEGGVPLGDAVTLRKAREH